MLLSDINFNNSISRHLSSGTHIIRVFFLTIEKIQISDKTKQLKNDVIMEPMKSTNETRVKHADRSPFKSSKEPKNVLQQ
jgi:hypothetical protein